MAFPFKTYRVLCATSPELEPERDIFQSTLATFGETVSFPQGILFAGATFREGFDASLHRAAAENNVRTCDFYVHIVGEEPQGRILEGFAKLALECAADESKPMRQVSVLFRKFAEAEEPVRQFRERLVAAGACTVMDFQNSGELESRLMEVFGVWFAMARE